MSNIKVLEGGAFQEILSYLLTFGNEFYTKNYIWQYLWLKK